MVKITTATAIMTISAIRTAQHLHPFCHCSMTSNKYKLGHHFSITQFGSPTAQIPLESGSSADKRFRTDPKTLIRTVSYTSHKPMYKVNDDGFIKPFEAKPS